MQNFMYLMFEDSSGPQPITVTLPDFNFSNSYGTASSTNNVLYINFVNNYLSMDFTSTISGSNIQSTTNACTFHSAVQYRYKTSSSYSSWVSIIQNCSHSVSNITGNWINRTDIDGYTSLRAPKNYSGTASTHDSTNNLISVLDKEYQFRIRLWFSFVGSEYELFSDVVTYNA